MAKLPWYMKVNDHTRNDNPYVNILIPWWGWTFLIVDVFANVFLLAPIRRIWRWFND